MPRRSLFTQNENIGFESGGTSASQSPQKTMKPAAARS